MQCCEFVTIFKCICWLRLKTYFLGFILLQFLTADKTLNCQEGHKHVSQHYPWLPSAVEKGNIQHRRKVWLTQIGLPITMWQSVARSGCHPPNGLIFYKRYKLSRVERFWHKMYLFATEPFANSHVCLPGIILPLPEPNYSRGWTPCFSFSSCYGGWQIRHLLRSILHIFSCNYINILHAVIFIKLKI
jgi:hypothetical protein